MGGEDADGLFGLALIEGYNHSDAHVEYVEHLSVVYLPVFLKELEYWKDLPRAFFHLDALSLAKDARNVLIEAASRNVSNPMHVAIAYHVQNLLNVDSRRSKSDKTERLSVNPRLGRIPVQGNRAVQLRVCLMQVQLIVGEYFADKAESVAVDACRGYSN